MHVIIPMSGMGERFIASGYTIPKPLIPVDGMPLIEHVAQLFPNDCQFTFICNTYHLEQSDLRFVLQSIAPSCRIVAIPPHKKGPVYAVSAAFEYIRDEEEVIINYCDFSKYWDFHDFMKHTRGRNADGALSAYRGFHPHMLRGEDYAFIKEDRQWLIEIKEKESFTDNKMQEFASDGTYYFKKGSLVKKYFTMVMENDINVNGEYYVSVVYNLLRKDNLKVSIYEIQQMAQLGTPRDIEECQRWSDYFRCMLLHQENGGSFNEIINLVPLAGTGKRFSDHGYALPKPLIEVSGNPMVIQATRCLPFAGKYIFACNAKHLKQYPLAAQLNAAFPSAKILEIENPTSGQACTCEIALREEDFNLPVLIGTCDSSVVWDRKTYKSMVEDATVDVIVWSFKRHARGERNPQEYGWLKIDKQGYVYETSVKKAISNDSYNDLGIIGTFYFRKVRYFVEALQLLYKNNIRINGEFYIDSCIDIIRAMGLRVKAFEVTHYVCWGTPEELETFEYWQSFFHKCSWHPYTLEKDTSMNPVKVSAYNTKYRAFHQAYR